jgi:chaperone BCS1
MRYSKGKKLGGDTDRKLYTNDSGNKWQIYKQTTWSYTVFKHPATVETLAMEPAKEEIIEDLVTFSKSKDFYARTGKTWKRGDLLYGPPESLP